MNRLRKIVRKRVSGSTLLETITASVIFMIVFVMAMDTLTRLLTFDSNDSDYIVIENELNKCKKQVCREELRPGTRTYQYKWGEIDVEISHYKDQVFQVSMVATGQKKHRKTSYRFLQANP